PRVRGGGGEVAFSSARFAVRGLVQSLAVELWPKGIHVAHVIIDGVMTRRKCAGPTNLPRKSPFSSPMRLPMLIGSSSNEPAAHGAWKSICVQTERRFSNDSLYLKMLSRSSCARL